MVDIIIASLLVPETPVPRKVARLHLICDILHNSAVPLPMAWKFRQEFQARLGIVFDHMSTIYHSFPGRITAETFKKQILGVIEIWEDWIVFTPEFTKELRDRLDGKTDTGGKKTTEAEEGSGKEGGGQTETKGYESKFKSSSFKPATEEAQAEELGDKGGEDIDGEPAVDDVDGEPLDGGDVDGEPLGGGDVDGVAMDDVDGEPLDGEPLDGELLDGEPLRDEDLDGEPMKGDDVDGEPMDEDVDGVQMLPD